jgi:hypothetical protein
VSRSAAHSGQEDIGKKAPLWTVHELNEYAQKSKTMAIEGKPYARMLERKRYCDVDPGPGFRFT